MKTTATTAARRSTKTAAAKAPVTKTGRTLAVIEGGNSEEKGVRRARKPAAETAPVVSTRIAARTPRQARIAEDAAPVAAKPARKVAPVTPAAIRDFDRREKAAGVTRRTKAVAKPAAAAAPVKPARKVEASAKPAAKVAKPISIERLLDAAAAFEGAMGKADALKSDKLAAQREAEAMADLKTALRRLKIADRFTFALGE